MKNSMWSAVLVMTVILVGAAQAGDDFKTYGKLHMSLEMLNNSEDSQPTVSNNGSRFGLKGAREMNDKFKMIWQFEQKINLAQKGSETLATRNSYLGLAGEWGTALFGIHDTPFKTMGSKVTFFRDEIGDYRQAAFNWDRRLQDVVLYITPNYDGISGRVMFEIDQGAMGAEEAKSIISGSASYKKEGLYLGVAYEMLSKAFAYSAWTDTTDAAAHVVNNVYGNSAQGIRAGAKYQMDKLGFSAIFQTLSDYNQGSFSVNEFDEGIAVENDKKAMTYGAEAEFQFAQKYSTKAGYYLADPNTDVDDDEFSLLAVGLDHQFSKDLWFYLQYAMVMNGDASEAALGCTYNGHGKIVEASGPGQNPSGFSLGMAMKF
ncbi:MAG: porin [Gemmatimonadales bacterium]|nr:porin [Gemmatimonadales bacterium]